MQCERGREGEVPRCYSCVPACALNNPFCRGPRPHKKHPPPLSPPPPPAGVLQDQQVHPHCRARTCATPSPILSSAPPMPAVAAFVRKLTLYIHTHTRIPDIRCMYKRARACAVLVNQPPHTYTHVVWPRCHALYVCVHPGTDAGLKITVLHGSLMCVDISPERHGRGSSTREGTSAAGTQTTSACDRRHTRAQRCRRLPARQADPGLTACQARPGSP
jgi:hypothetical protein